MDILWLKDDSLEDLENLPAPEVIADEIKENFESALDSINELINNLGKNNLPLGWGISTLQEITKNHDKIDDSYKNIEILCEKHHQEKEGRDKKLGDLK